ncbi:MAG: NAD(P)H-dependent oxidoreductase subunit E [Bacteroidetes bacterium]|nr:NAD(P)H-dependent oxidoreductase subunit E [Bacteroidota bacterium]
MKSKIDEIIEKQNNTDRSDLLDVLQEIQVIEGYLSEEAIIKTSQYFKLASAKIYGIASFYDHFKFVPQGRFHIKVCNGTACHLANTSNLRKEFEKILKIQHGQCTRDGMFSIEYVPCMGACGISSVISINEEYYSSVKPSDVKDMLENLRNTDDRID